MMRQRLVVGNWKMHGSTSSVWALLDDLALNLDGAARDTRGGASAAGAADAALPVVVVCPSFVHLQLADSALEDLPIALGAQDVCRARGTGAYTGEVGAGMLAELGVQFVIVGHSERRHGFGETDEAVAEKSRAAAAEYIRPIICVGETAAERKAGKTDEVVCGQLQAVLDYGTGSPSARGKTAKAGATRAKKTAKAKAKVPAKTATGAKGAKGAKAAKAATGATGVKGAKGATGAAKAESTRFLPGNAVVAYEPVWAIGTGDTATPEQAQAVHARLRSLLAEYDAALAELTPILYGGSVNGDNAAALFAQPDIDGGLVGGASLRADEFAAICRSFGS